MLTWVLAACGTTSPPGTDLGDYTAAPRDLIGVAASTDRHTVHIGGASYISKIERERLATFITEVAGNRPESLRITLHGPARSAQRKAVADALIADGVPPSQVAMGDPELAPHPKRGMIIVAAERAFAIVPNCPGWLDHVSAPGNNRTSPNFGCSDVSNFAAMVSDPRHLTKGASNVYHDGERGATAVASYRADKVKDLPKTTGQFSVIPTAR
jgi:pilus biogenesis lipoprotein CpaD